MMSLCSRHAFDVGKGVPKECALRVCVLEHLQSFYNCNDEYICSRPTAGYFRVSCGSLLARLEVEKLDKTGRHGTEVIGSAISSQGRKYMAHKYIYLGEGLDKFWPVGTPLEFT